MKTIAGWRCHQHKARGYALARHAPRRWSGPTPAVAVPGPRALGNVLLEKPFSADSLIRAVQSVTTSSSTETSPMHRRQ